MLEDRAVLIIEDGDEYRDNLIRWVPGPRYLQAHDAAAAIALLASEPVAIIYLDMRFDRIPRERLAGEVETIRRQQGGDAERAWRYLQNNQGLFILDALRQAGFSHLPTILAYDFSAEPRRLAHLQSQHPNLTWVRDAVGADEVRELMERLLVH
jgi:hypothetical protein